MAPVKHLGSVKPLGHLKRLDRVKRLDPVKHWDPVRHLGPVPGPALARVREVPVERARAGQQRLCAARAPPPCWWPMMNWEGRLA